MSARAQSTRVKICGITTRDDLGLAVDAGTDAIGVIVDVRVDTPREIPAERARAIVAATPPLVTSVLVTMPATAGDALALAERISPDAIQINGRIEADALARIGASHQLIRAVDADDERAIDAAIDHADALLLDSTDEAGAGGTGRTHDWTLARDRVDTLDIPVILAGGLTPENVAEAIAVASPYAVDVASGVEANGRKDADAVRTFVERASTGRRG